MNKKRLMTACAILLSALFLFTSFVFADPPVPNSAPGYKVSKYDYDGELPDVCFFPKDKAKWNGYEVTNWDWLALSDDQKNLFISEGVAELERTKDAVVKVENKSRLVSSINKMSSSLSDQYPNSKASMIRILLDCLKDEGYIKFNPAQNKPAR